MADDKKDQAPNPAPTEKQIIDNAKAAFDAKVNKAANNQTIRK